MRKTLTSLAAGLVIAAGSGTSGAAPITFFDQDSNQSSSVPLTEIPNSTAAQIDFGTQVTGLGTQNFESPLTTNSDGSLNLTFPGSSGNLTATLSGGNGAVKSAAPGTSVDGRYSVPSENSSKFWEVAATTTGDFTLSFSSAIGAFGFFGIDIGDVGAKLSLEFLIADADGKLSRVALIDLPVNTGDDGSVFFFGYVAGSTADLFTSVRFILDGTGTSTSDVFAFDNFTIGDRCQVNSAPTSDLAQNCPTDGGGGGGGGEVPEPGSLALVAAAIAGARFSRRRTA